MFPADVYNSNPYIQFLIFLLQADVSSVSDLFSNVSFYVHGLIISLHLVIPHSGQYYNLLPLFMLFLMKYYVDVVSDLVSDYWVAVLCSIICYVWLLLFPPLMNLCFTSVTNKKYCFFRCCSCFSYQCIFFRLLFFLGLIFLVKLFTPFLVVSIFVYMTIILSLF